MSTTISYQDWSDFLLRIGAICEPSEFQGFAVGYACTLQSSTPEQWRVEVKQFMDLIGDADAEVDGALAGFLEVTQASLNEGQYQLSLMLPDDVLPLADRVVALAKWCQGFLHGVASAGEGIAKVLDSAAQESLNDIAQIAQAQSAASDEVEEGYYADLVEYIRLAVFNMHSQFHAAKSSDGKPTTH